MFWPCTVSLSGLALLQFFAGQLSVTFASSAPKASWVVVMYTTRYTHAHCVPHAEHVESWKWRSAVETTPCCPPPIPFTGQRAK